MERAIEDALRAYEAMYTEARWDPIEAHVTPDLVIDWSESIGPLRGVYRGTDAAREMFSHWGEAFSEMGRTTHGWRRLGNRVLVQATIVARGAGSGVEATAGAAGAELLTLDGDRIASVKLVQRVDDAWREIRLAHLTESKLYFVCDARPHGEDPRRLLDAALRGGADLVQLRDPALDDDEMVAAATPFREAAREHGALFILNDRPDLVAACDADGAHVGQDDAPVAEARQAAGPSVLVGLSTHSPAQVDAAVAAEGDDRPDQISVGPIWETPTKPGRPPTGLELLRHAAERSSLPWFAIGGIDAANVGEVAASGAERVVVVRAIRDADDPEAAARKLRDAVERSGAPA